MKKIFYSILLSLFILLPVNVLAKGGVSLSTNSLTIEEGSSKTFIITAYNTIGDVSILVLGEQEWLAKMKQKEVPLL